MRTLLLLYFCFGWIYTAFAQSRPIRTDEYDRAKTFTVKDLDNDTYVKFNNAYVLDRYEMRKPYIITGDDGLKKRIDLYRLVAKDSMMDIGTVIFYTNEKGTLYTAVLPLFNSNPEIWNKYFEDIHAIDKVEKNYVLKLSYVLSREFSFQLYKSMNAGKDVKAEGATYGTDICFPGDEQVTLADGSQKTLKNILPGDKIISLDAVTHTTSIMKVKELVVHQPANYAITQLLAVHVVANDTQDAHVVSISGKILQATPNHPIQTSAGKKKMGEVSDGEELLCIDEQSKQVLTYVVVNKTEKANGTQPVYNIVAEGEGTFIMNSMMVLQK
ncbi:Hint domain-containing protein [Chitinophaga sp. LS1]|uniref:Hint domain-containing protein n=1 Tax=Chitinophaga sp. LS1 TaxID=3051176 RepID=UPI002AAADEAB|nr:Hint domain-containing protein [Chitinophaga sp. LS1]WPV67905.1 Hint domain-containing protein [Chitinophaga sp. LS1]